MKLATFEAGAGAEIGVVRGDTIFATGLSDSLIHVLKNWDTAESAVERAIRDVAARPLSQVRLLAPISRPGKIFAIGLNYADHIAESKAETPPHQVWFAQRNGASANRSTRTRRSGRG